MREELRRRLQMTADEVVEILAKKDDQYGSSWKSHGGFSAFFNLDRKYSRIQTMASEQKYDLFAAIRTNPDGTDSLKDLIGYALLTLSETYNPPGYADPEGDEAPGVDYTDQDRATDRTGDTPMTGVEEPVKGGSYA